MIAERILVETIAAGDGHLLGVERFVPLGEPEAVVLIAAAMGVPQRYYRKFAAWLARQGFLVLSFDYRGVGASASHTLRSSPATLSDWIQLDCAAMLDNAAVAAGDRPLIWLGHSLGAQILPLVPHAERVTKMVAVASGAGYWREHELPMRWVAWWLWRFLSPVAIKLFGYFPGARLGKVGDLPAGVMLQWRRWCLDPRYSAGAEGAEAAAKYAAFQRPIYSLSFTDDEYMSARNIHSMHALFARAPLEAARIAPRDLGASRIGHFGCFKPEFEATLWRTHLLPALRLS
jgi:predicted alpha/beta hydrolase